MIATAVQHATTFTLSRIDGKGWCYSIEQHQTCKE
jgi:hypothetical protein